jgi:adenylosuccinate synthase
MSVRIVVGAQWGDEGKGKIVDLLASEADVVARYQGGANAGHTICHGDRRFILRLIPSGILHDGVMCILGNGVVVDPVALFEELQGLRDQGVQTEGRLLISPHAHIIFPYHKLIDQAKERYLGENQVGTTQRGIGPAYLDKIDRCGIRAVDLLDRANLTAKLEKNLEEKNKILRAFGAAEQPVQPMIQQFCDVGERLRPLVVDTVVYLHRAIRDGREVLLEGAQGTMLDIDHGTYPFVTSSNATSGGACTGLGIGPTHVDRVMGVVKAYTTRVGNGPLPTEFEPAFADRVRNLGGEFGSVTGRPRRIGWLDLVQIRYAVMVNGINELAVTKLDVLDTLEELHVCTEYRTNGKPVDLSVADARIVSEVQPVYRTLPGWQASTNRVRTLKELPKPARDYLQFIETSLGGVPIRLVSVGQERQETIRV